MSFNLYPLVPHLGVGSVPLIRYRLRCGRDPMKIEEEPCMTNLMCSHLGGRGTQGPLFLTLPFHSRQKIFKEKALPDIENYMFENHDQLRQAATECMCNMVINKEVRLGLQGTGSPRCKHQAWVEAGAPGDEVTKI